MVNLIMPRITIYTQPNCKESERLKDVLASKSITFEERDVSKDVMVKREMIERTGGKKITPQIFINGKNFSNINELKEQFGLTEELTRAN